MTDKQLELFPLAPRDEGKAKVDWSKGGIRELDLARFKRFKEFHVDFDRITLLVGTNSSGKTSMLQAIRLFFWCIKSCLRPGSDGYRFAKTVIPFSDFHLIPAHNLRELSFRGMTPNSRTLGIVLKGTLESGLVLSFRIYASYSTLMVIDPEKQPSQPLTEDQVSYINRPPLYIPGFFSVVTRELLTHDARLEELLNSGHHNEVLRNIILRLRGDKNRLSRLLRILDDEFGVTRVDLPFSDKTTEFLKAEYVEPAMRVPLDFVSAGSGFLQVLQVMAHALQNPSPILLLDEPDAHMHHSLQKSFLKVLRLFADQEDLQVVMASHSETLLREIPLEEVRVIEASWPRAGKFTNAYQLQEQLSEAGIWPTHLEMAEILRTRRVLLLESEGDAVTFHKLASLKCKDWDSRSRMLRLVYSQGSDDNVVRRLEYVQEILSRIMPEGVKIAHLRDRDLLCDAAIDAVRKDAEKKKLPLFVTHFRNRECMLIQPELVERALRHKYGADLPGDLKDSGAIIGLIRDEILKWCKEQVDELVVKVQEYNRSWIKRTFEQETLKDGDKLVATFIRESWQEPLAKGIVPWKLVDGKAALKRIRRRLEEYKLQLPDSSLLEVMTEGDFDQSIKKTVELVLQWF